MFRTKYGPFNGDTWEDLCQQIFKKKYGEEGYQEMAASPGDFGIEGFTKKTGLSFQCYCPDRQYTQKELYEKQRDKITYDLGKLKKYKDQIEARIGDIKICEWVFVTPEVNQNKILEHAQAKQEDVRKWGLSILSDDFTVLVRDGEFYATEIIHFQTVHGEKLVFDDISSTIPLYDDGQDLSEYENNIEHKNKIRCDYANTNNDTKLQKLNSLTFDNWVGGEGLLKRIESTAPKIYYHISRVINQYESEVSELSLSWQGNAEELTGKVRETLSSRLKEELPDLSTADRRQISQHMVAKWIALCPLDFD
ncbi:MAG: hypothetical protein JAY90_22355 [Candidatus Thiodiazotropha lotti]|nr:hypothetical protein [Candidatus Thiodiazotropha lotti]